MEHRALIEEIESWLIDSALGDPDITELFQKLCERLAGVGLPLDRAALTWPTLHPLFRAEQIFWNPRDGAVFHQYSHANQETDGWLRSPFYHVLQNDLDRLRRRLTGPNALLDFDILNELKEQGFTDYLMTCSEFRIGEVSEFANRGTGILASFATKRDGGFTSDDLSALSHIQRVFAVACRVAIQRRVTANLVNTYLGPTAGWKALSGEIKRGDGERIRAVVYYADLRNSTRLSEAMDPDDYLTLLRDYFDCAAQPVIAEGGEILDYIGDAVLAIFPIKGDTGGPEAVRAACRAMEAALERREAMIAETPEKPIRFCISMAVGEVMFGNIGVPERLSFSVIGSVVNEVARMDDATKTLGRSVLVTKEVASIDAKHWESIGEHVLEGVPEPVELFARTCCLDAFKSADVVSIGA